ncbi:MAG TPA: hypothetical protein VHM48_08755 [Candidatus Limnocylindrales bacterium]|nr:hypothetical protein [Candidatus Limnocylindrales bacterium]
MTTAILVAGCGSTVPEPTIIAIPTSAAGGGCLDAPVGGRVITSQRWGIAIADETGRVSKLFWPNGVHGQMDGDRVALVDGSGRLVAHVGDTIRSGGGFIGANGDPDNTMMVCGEIRAIVP